MPGDADEADEPRVARLDRGAQGAVLAHRDVPVAGVHEAVQLDQVDRGHLHALERALDLVARRRVGALAGLRGEEEAVAVPGEAGREPQLGVAVARGGVDVVDAVLEQQLDRLVGVALADVAERGRAEDDAGALVAGAAEGLRRRWSCE